MTDDWRGEGLIRSHERLHAENGKKPPRSGSMLKRGPAISRLCRVPGCKQELWGDSTTGVCGQHRHDPAWCMCLKCQNKKERK